jgi:hypothetical protein
MSQYTVSVIAGTGLLFLMMRAYCMIGVASCRKPWLNSKPVWIAWGRGASGAETPGFGI